MQLRSLAVFPQSRSSYHVSKARIRSIVRRLLILVFTSHALVNPLATNCQPSVGLAATPAVKRNSTRSSESAASWDCTGKGEWGTTILPPHIIDAINLAEKTLRDCGSCRVIYGDADPLELLDTLVKKKAIVMATRIPIIRKTIRRSKPKSDPIDPRYAAQILDLTGRNVDYPRPCVFINATSKSFMAANVPPENYGLYGLSLLEARAVVILHELGHYANAIQDDSLDPEGRISFANTDCIRLNCMPCLEKHIHSTGVPRRCSSNYGQRLPSNGYFRKARVPKVASMRKNR
jgi:hypothetical protein